MNPKDLRAGDIYDDDAYPDYYLIKFINDVTATGATVSCLYRPRICKRFNKETKQMEPNGQIEYRILANHSSFIPFSSVFWERETNQWRKIGSIPALCGKTCVTIGP